MSRLDDELKLMFQREEPSADFAERVLARINLQAQPKASLWQRLIAFFQPNRLRWAVATAALVLIAVYGFVQYQRAHQDAADNQVAKDQTTPMVEKDRDDIKNPESEKTSDIEQERITRVKNQKLHQHRSQRLKYPKESSVKNEEVIAKQNKSEGEIAKEQLMKALFIASATVNEAKKLAIGDD